MHVGGLHKSCVCLAPKYTQKIPIIRDQIKSPGTYIEHTFLSSFLWQQKEISGRNRSALSYLKNRIGCDGVYSWLLQCLLLSKSRQEIAFWWHVGLLITERIMLPQNEVWFMWFMLGDSCPWMRLPTRTTEGKQQPWFDSCIVPSLVVISDQKTSNKSKAFVTNAIIAEKN